MRLFQENLGINLLMVNRKDAVASFFVGMNELKVYIDLGLLVFIDNKTDYYIKISAKE